MEAIRETYTWAQEMVGMIWSFTLVTRPFVGNKILHSFFHKSGYIHYCIADPTGPCEEG